MTKSSGSPCCTTGSSPAGIGSELTALPEKENSCGVMAENLDIKKYLTCHGCHAPLDDPKSFPSGALKCRLYSTGMKALGV